ncbi:MAG: hypothetical protein ACKVS8_06135 [Phycisphaerales bacterium]
MRTFEVWYAIPSASPARCHSTLPRWRERGYRVAVLQNVERAEIPADLCVWSDTYPGWAESINILSKAIVPATADLVVSGGCDMLPDPDHTAQELAAQFFEHFPDGFGVMQPHGDTFRNARHYCGSPFLGRAWIDSMYGGRGPMFGGYRHNWGDLELYWVAKCLGSLWERPDLSHFHDHPHREHAAATPDWWLSNVERHDRADVELYLSRSRAHFPGHEPVDPPYPRRFDPRPLPADTARLAERHHEALYGRGHENVAQVRMTAALRALAERGVGPVGIYGAGAHTRRAAAAIGDASANVACIIDDNPALRGTRLGGVRIVSSQDAAALGLRAVVLSSDAQEDALWNRTADLRARGVEVVRLYSPASAQPVPLHAGAST